MRWIFRFLLILHLKQISIADCRTKFFAKRIAYEDASSLSFYFTSTDISSTAECAKFCAKRQFCRTAMFNALAATCSISYDWKVNCRHHFERYESFVTSKKHLVLIACVEGCKSTHSMESDRQDSSTKDISASDIRTNNLLTTIQIKNNDIQRYDEVISKPLTTKDSNRISSMERISEDENESESMLASPSRYPHYVYRVILDRYDGIRKTISNGDREGNDPSESYRKFPEIPSKKTAPSEHIKASPIPTKKSISETPNVAIPSQRQKVSPKIIEEKQLSNSANKKLNENDEELVHENGERAFPLHEWKKISAEKKDTGNGEGFLNKIILEGIHANNAETIHDSSAENVLNEERNSLGGTNNNERRMESLKLFPVSHWEIATCFDMIKRQFLLNAGYEMHANISREECRCLCAETWNAKWSTRRCKSFQYNAFRECLLNKDDHFGKYDLVYDFIAEYHFINCSEPLFSARSMNDCPKQFHQILNEQTAAEVFSHSFEASLPVLSISPLGARNRTDVDDFLKTNKATTTTSTSSSTTLQPLTSSRKLAPTDIPWLMKTSYEGVIAFESTPKEIFHSVTATTTPQMTSAELSTFRTPADASVVHSETGSEKLTTNNTEGGSTTPSISKSTEDLSDSSEFFTASVRSVTTATLSSIYPRLGGTLTDALKKSSLESAKANISTEVAEMESATSRKPVMSQKPLPQLKNAVGSVQSQKADVNELKNVSKKPTSERPTTELTQVTSESGVIESAKPTPESREIEPTESAPVSGESDSAESTPESVGTKPTESAPASGESDSAESKPESGGTYSTESTPVSRAAESTESAPESGETDSAESTQESGGTKPTESALASRESDSAESKPESGRTYSTESTPAGQATDPTESAPESGETDLAESTPESVGTKPTESAPASGESDSAESKPESGGTYSTESTPGSRAAESTESAPESGETDSAESTQESGGTKPTESALASRESDSAESKPESGRTYSTESTPAGQATDPTESAPESGETDLAESTSESGGAGSTESTSGSRVTDTTESTPESEETDSTESTPEGRATDSTESTTERAINATAESVSQNPVTWLTQSTTEGGPVEAVIETSTESSTTSMSTTVIELQQIRNHLTTSTLAENEEDDEKIERVTSTHSTTSNKSNNIIIDGSEISKPMTSSIPTSTVSCFEVLDGFLMKSTAGGLENDVSLEECKCFCATSRISSRYSFQCASATYYHNERDCVLNLDIRIQRANLLQENSQRALNVSYISMLCSPEESIKHISDEKQKNGCRTPMPSSILTTTQSSTTKSASGKYTDSCFLELPNFVLEGMALAVEDNISIEECKCYCINAHYRYGSECQSLQYYFDSKTCLINKENRLSNLDRFNFAPTVTMKHSYFDFRCLTDQGVLSIYMAEVCSTIMDIKPKWKKLTKNDLSYESDDQKNDKREGNEIFDDKIHIKPIKLHSSMINIRVEPTNTPAGIQNKQSATFGDDEEENVSTPSSHIPTVGTYSPWKFEVSEEAISEAEEAYDATHTDDMKTLKSTTTLVSNWAPASTNGDITTVLPSTLTTNEDISITMQTEAIATTQETTATTTYIPAGPCTYSAIYQTSFRGAKLIKRILVSNPAECFSGCYHEGCRSANLIQFSGLLKYCELYRDALIDYRTPDVLGFDSSAVYFDGIKCEGINA